MRLDRDGQGAQSVVLPFGNSCDAVFHAPPGLFIQLLQCVIFIQCDSTTQVEPQCSADLHGPQRPTQIQEMPSRLANEASKPEKSSHPCRIIGLTGSGLAVKACLAFTQQ